MSFIEEFYYGNIRPSDKAFVQGTPYAKALDVFCENEKKLLNSLSGEELQKLNRMLEANEKITSETARENFALGFKLGVQMMCECLTHCDNNIFMDIK